MKARALLAAGVLLALLGAAVYFWRAGGARFAPEAAEVSALRQQLEQLQDEFEELAGASPDEALGSAPSDSLVIGVPTSVARDIAQQIVAGYQGNLRLTLRDKNVKTKSGDVEGKVLFSRRTVGSYVLQTRILKVTAALRPRELKIAFAGQRLGFSLPVAVSDGHGRAQLSLTWDSKGVAELVCGDVEATRELEGRVIPTVYTLSGHFDVIAEKGALLLRPQFDDTQLRVRLEATPQAWAALEELIDSRSGLCQHAIEKADVKGQLAEILTRGFDVRLPKLLLRDLALPASVHESLQLKDTSFLLKAKPERLQITPTRIWYGSSVTAERVVS